MTEMNNEGRTFGDFHRKSKVLLLKRSYMNSFYIDSIVNNDKNSNINFGNILIFLTLILCSKFKETFFHETKVFSNFFWQKRKRTLI